MLLFSARFQSTPSARRATDSVGQFQAFHGNFNPRPPRGERPWPAGFHRCTRLYFNPRPPRGERLPASSWRKDPKANFNPRPPRGERLNFKITVHFCRRFQSTPSARRATPRLMRLRTPRHRFQSTPSARRATRRKSNAIRKAYISIHALREESDGHGPGLRPCRQNFNPRPPRGERHATGFTRTTSFPISIHALREESDNLSITSGEASENFNPRPPRGERRLTVSTMALRMQNFNPRPPRGERPPASVHTAQQAIISIHALREESDELSCLLRGLLQNFNPRPPRGGRPCRTW